MTAPPPIAPERLREISWILGQGFPRPFGADQIHFAFVHPHLGFLWWNIGEPAAAAARAGLGEAGADARPVVRVHDVTDVRFDGTNAHHSWDLEVRHLQGNYYHRHNRLGRHLLAEIGLKTRAGAFRPLARSNAVAFDRDRPVRDFRPEGLYVARDFQLVFPVENIFGARHYERLVRELPAFPLPRPAGRRGKPAAR